MMKRELIARILSCLLVVTMIVTLAACDRADDTKNAQTEEKQESGKILIAYFTAAENSGVDAVSSASYTTIGGTAVGRLRAVADMIQENTDGDLFSIQTAVVYPSDGGELIDYAAEEQDENARPELTSHIEDLDQYGTIFVGFPTWLAYHKLIQCTQA